LPSVLAYGGFLSYADQSINVGCQGASSERESKIKALGAALEAAQKRIISLQSTSEAERASVATKDAHFAETADALDKVGKPFRTPLKR